MTLLRYFLIFSLGAVFGLALAHQFEPKRIKHSLKSLNPEFPSLVLKREKASTYPATAAPVVCPQQYVGIVGFGQSNISNRIKRERLVAAVDDQAFMYDWTDGQCYHLREPLVGTDSVELGSVLTDLVIELRQSGLEGNILIAPLAKGGSSIFEWHKGPGRVRLTHFMTKATEQQLRFDFWFWQQGEHDAHVDAFVAMKQRYLPGRYGTVEGIYSDLLSMIFDDVKMHFPEAQFGVSLTSSCSVDVNQNIIKAQQDVIRSRADSFLSTDTDALGAEYRWDGCHFNEKGASAIGRDYAERVMEALARKGERDV